jgi:nicotinate-nucleotide pyrophosphorylase (carboxylating)
MDRKALSRFTHDSGNFLNVSNTTYKQWVFRYTFLELEKDLGLYGDVTSDVLFGDSQYTTFKVVSRTNGILAGRQEIEYFLMHSDSNLRPRLIGNIDVRFLVDDGAGFGVGDTIAEIYGDIRDLLAVERTVLNLLNRMSNVATSTACTVDIVKDYDCLVVPTRKTLWGLLDKRGCSLGGAGTHRLSLSDAILVKDTHLDSGGRDFAEAFRKIEDSKPDVRFVEFEVGNVSEALEVAKLFYESDMKIVGVIMLDNIPPDLVFEALGEVKGAGYYDSVLFEASGGITDVNVLEYAKTGVDIISMGSLTSGVGGVDLGMEG